MNDHTTGTGVRGLKKPYKILISYMTGRNPNKKLWQTFDSWLVGLRLPTFIITTIPTPARTTVSSTTGLRRIKRMAILISILKFYLAVPVAMLSSSLLGYVSPISTIRFWSRAITCYCSLLLCASYGVIASILLRIVGKPTLAQWTVAKAFAWMTSPLIGWDFDVQGAENLTKHRPAVFISNHQRYSSLILSYWCPARLMF
jgi:hypothetical protein